MKVQVGDEVRFAKTVSESDVYLFAGISGDFYAAHVDEEAMRATPFGRRITHGALLVGFMSAAGTMMIHKVASRGDGTIPVSLGYDRLRFVAPVFISDTVTVVYAVTGVDAERRRSTAAVTVLNQKGEQVAVAEHLMKWLAGA
jgi:3-hydroxybutyryl-CoA dehydratase